MTKDEALDLALEALESFAPHNGVFWRNLHKEDAEITNAITAIKQARALDKMADNARELGLDYEPVQEPDAYGYAKRLAEAIWKKHYQSTAPQWEPFDHLIGVLTQIDNMTSGLTIPPAAQPELDCRVSLQSKPTPPPAAPVQEPRWYCIDKTGMATLCADEDDAKQSVKLAEQDWPRHAPYRAVQLCEYTAPPAAQKAQHEPLTWLKTIETPGGFGKFVEAKPNEKGAKPVYLTPPAQPATVQEPDVAFLRQVLSVAIAGLYEHYKDDVLRVFTLDDLQTVVDLADPLQSQQVEDIYKRAWEMLATPPATQPALDLQAELEATNRQVEILSDALAESRREVAQLKAQPAPVQEPVMLEMDGKQLTLGEALDEAIAATERSASKRLNAVLVAAKNALYTTPPAAQRQWVGLTPHERMMCRSYDIDEAIANTEAKLKEKNNGM